MSKSQVSVLCADLDVQVAVFRERRLESAYPYLMLGALYVSMRGGAGSANRRWLSPTASTSVTCAKSPMTRASGE
jgi:transposase-like protein